MTLEPQKSIWTSESALVVGSSIRKDKQSLAFALIYWGIQYSISYEKIPSPMKWKFIIFIDLDGLGCIETPGDAALKHEIFIQHWKAWILSITLSFFSWMMNRLPVADMSYPSSNHTRQVFLSFILLYGTELFSKNMAVLADPGFVLVCNNI